VHAFRILHGRKGRCARTPHVLVVGGCAFAAAVRVDRRPRVRNVRSIGLGAGVAGRRDEAGTTQHDGGSQNYETPHRENPPRSIDDRDRRTTRRATASKPKSGDLSGLDARGRNQERSSRPARAPGS
jgi:hypothetical protein